MDRKEFIRICGMSCIGLAAGLSLSNCSGTRYIQGSLDKSSLNFPVSSFIDDNGKKLDYVVVENGQLNYPIAVFRSGQSYQGVYMRCTHQGTELQVFGDRLQCPAHGSEFLSTGEVQNGPADENLRLFEVNVIEGTIKINLT